MSSQRKARTRTPPVAHGLTDAEIAEIIATTALSIFTNYFNHVAGTAVDFPAAPKLATCACAKSVVAHPAGSAGQAGWLQR